MYTCTVLIPYVKELCFLTGCVNQIKKHNNKEIDIKIIIADQSSKKNYDYITNLYKNDPSITIIKIPQIDAGYPIDKGLEICDTEYFCSLDVDAFPISNKWLYIPIKIIEKFNLSFIGKETTLQDCYKHLGNFLILNNFFRVSKTSVAKEISDSVGFISPQNKHKSDLSYSCKLYDNLQTDNGVIAQLYSDVNKFGNKLSFKMNKIIGETPSMGVYGMVIEDLIFHMVFGFSEHWIGNQAGVLGNDYIHLKNDIINNGLSDKHIEILLSKTGNIEDKTTKERANLFNKYTHFDCYNNILTHPEDDDIIKYLIALKDE